MAVITGVTRVGSYTQHIGNRTLRTIRVTPVSGQDDYVAAGSASTSTGLHFIDRILGAVPIGSTAVSADFPAMRKNVRQNASGSEGDNPGDLAFEFNGTTVWEVSLLGKL